MTAVTIREIQKRWIDGVQLEIAALGDLRRGSIGHRVAEAAFACAAINHRQLQFVVHGAFQGVARSRLSG
ncbi:MAG TPA: hypothetical protein VLF15_02865 [Pseudoxanthomonas sp.]|nr:hypothetical protein [Pseudoxanthomonas sp.]